MKRLLMTMLVMAIGVSVAGAQDTKREITRVTDDVYRFQNQFHMNMFGLKAEIGQLTDQPITHLVYSHSHGDHASGGTEYGDVPNVIMHQNAQVKPSN